MWWIVVCTNVQCQPTSGGPRWPSWLRHCATSRKVAGSIPDGVIGIFHWHNPSSRTMTLGSTQPVTEMNTRNISWRVKAAGAYGWQPYNLHVQIVRNSGSPNLLEPPEPVHGLLFVYLSPFPSDIRKSTLCSNVSACLSNNNIKMTFSKEHQYSVLITERRSTQRKTFPSTHAVHHKSQVDWSEIEAMTPR